MDERKIKMEKVQTRKHATFSRRRSGVFKKASELATKCNAKVGIVIFSPEDKPYSFGTPSLDVVLERFKNEDEESDNIDEGSINELEKLQKHLNSINEKVDAEEKRGKEYQKRLESAGERFEKNLEELTLEKLNENKDMLEKMHGMIQSNIDRMQASTALMLLSKDKGYGGE